MRNQAAPAARAGGAASGTRERHLTDDMIARLLSLGSDIVSDAARDLLIDPTEGLRCMSLPRLEAALSAAWTHQTAYLGVACPGNPALGQCYPTARVIQWFFPELEIASGAVDTGAAMEAHFWNIDESSDPPTHIDPTWQQFPPGSIVRKFAILDRTALGDGPATIARCQLLLHRVLAGLARQHGRS
jgi:hypothetical protein